MPIYTLFLAAENEHALTIDGCMVYGLTAHALFELCRFTMPLRAKRSSPV